jgi:cell division protein FtsN
VQVGAFSKLVNAVSLKDDLKAEFPTARIDEMRSSRGTLLYRVRVGPFVTRAEAVRAEERLRALGHEPVRYDSERAG